VTHPTWFLYNNRSRRKLVEGFFLRHARSALVTLQRDFFFTLYRLATCFFLNFSSYFQLTDHPYYQSGRERDYCSFLFFLHWNHDFFVKLNFFCFKATEQWIFNGSGMHSGCAEKCLKRHFDHRRVDKKFRQGARASINGWEFKILRSKFFRIFFWWCCPSIPVGGFLCRSLEVLVGGIFVSVHLHVSHVTFFRTGGLIHLNESLLAQEPSTGSLNWYQLKSRGL